MHWIVTAPFFGASREPWLIPFAADPALSFTAVPPHRAGASWHLRARPHTPGAEWPRLWRTARRAWCAQGDGVVTLFPQLAAAVAAHKRLGGSSRPLVAWSFNLGRTYGGARQIAARWALAAVDRFVVHSRAECRIYAEWLGLPRERFRFVPLSRPLIPPLAGEDEERPFLVCLGSARRDFRVLFEAVERLNLRTVVVAARHALRSLRVPNCVELRSGLSLRDCWVLTQEARLSVVPLDNAETASGQRTIVDAMASGRPVIATRSIGTEDYIQHGVTGLLVEPGSTCALTHAIEFLWKDEGMRRGLRGAARQHAASSFSDETCGAALRSVLREFA